MITKKICPNCGKSDMQMVAGGTTGNWMCQDCGFMGMPLEKEIIEKKDEEAKNE